MRNDVKERAVTERDAQSIKHDQERKMQGN